MTVPRHRLKDLLPSLKATHTDRYTEHSPFVCPFPTTTIKTSLSFSSPSGKLNSHLAVSSYQLSETNIIVLPSAKWIRYLFYPSTPYKLYKPAMYVATHL